MAQILGCVGIEEEFTTIISYIEKKILEKKVKHYLSLGEEVKEYVKDINSWTKVHLYFCHY